MAELAEWDEELLMAELEGLAAEGITMDDVGFDLDALEALGASAEPEGNPEADAEPQIDKAEELRAKWGVEPGQLWELGDHRILCGDCTNAGDIEKLMCGEYADLWITDPPYNVAIQGGNHGDPNRTNGLKIENDSMDDASFRAFLVAAYGAADVVMKEGAVFYVWHADSEGFNFRGAAQDIGWKVRQCIVWAKSSLVMGRQDYQWKHEPCLYGWKEGAGHYWGSDRKQTTVMEFNRPQRNGEHPTMKPVELFAYQIGNSSKAGGVVLDSFSGSGTTIIACEQIGRKCRAIEISPGYCAVAIERWSAATGKTPRRIS
jgi:site-specific DNA-methyltransferase (adenine-specific)